jgi:argininosuccinate lyase
MGFADPNVQHPQKQNQEKRIAEKHEMSKTLRGGRLGAKRDDVAQFTSSIKADSRLVKSVIDINKGHVVMLAEQKIITSANAAKLLKALAGKLELKMDASSEDVHMAVEEAVLRKTGQEVGGNMHIGKSRNDQVATAIRMELRRNLLSLISSVQELQTNLAETAAKHVETIVLGYTHLQPAQPVTFAHYLLARFDQLGRDVKRLRNAYVTVNLCPLGAGALATTSFSINRERTAKLLGFDGLAENSIDAVGSRDFILETLATLTILAVDMSQFAEDLLLWSSIECGVLELPDEFASTSSMMPQKKNAEVPEIIRARASSVLGDFVAAASIMKAMPSTYNLDFQEVTPKLWEACETVEQSLRILAELVPNLQVLSKAALKDESDFVGATELANMLVKKYCVPFRSAHKIVGAVIKKLVSTNQTLKNATPELVQNVAKVTIGITISLKTSDITEALEFKKIVENHSIIGGPAPLTVKKALAARKKQMVESKSDLSKLSQGLEIAQEHLESAVKLISDGKISDNGRLKKSERMVE